MGLTKTNQTSFKKNMIPWNKGKRYKLPKASIAKKGKHYSVSTEFKKGQVPWNKGKKGLQVGWSKGLKLQPLSEETKQKLSKALKGHPVYKSIERNLKISTAQKGRKFTEERKKNIRKGQQRYWESKQPTSIERTLYDFLLLNGILFERQKLINDRFVVDAYIPSLNLVIEADGKYWHARPERMKKDKAENAYLKKCGFELLRLSEEEINTGEFKEKLAKSGIFGTQIK